MLAFVSTDGPHAEGEDLTALLAELDRALRRAEEVPVSSYEEMEGDALSPLFAETRAAVGSAVDVVSSILAHYDEVVSLRASRLDLATHATEAGLLLGEVERAMVEEVGVRRIQNLAFLARMGLRARLAALDGMGASPGKWELIAAASSALREVMKALGALAVAVCGHEVLPEPRTFYVTELERSLTIRRAYRIFHADIAPAREPHGPELAQRLRRAANAIAKLAGRPVYPSMRVTDRFALRALQRRLHAWLAAGDLEPRAREVAGVRLFQDLAHLAELMQGVNERAELRAHDARLIAAQIAALEAGAAVGCVALALRAVEGRDARLDALLAREDPPREALLLRLRELCAKLAPTAQSQPAPRPSPADLVEGDDFI